MNSFICPRVRVSAEYDKGKGQHGKKIRTLNITGFLFNGSKVLSKALHEIFPCNNQEKEGNLKQPFTH